MRHAHAALISSPLACGATPSRSCAVLNGRSVALSSLSRVDWRASNIGGHLSRQSEHVPGQVSWPMADVVADGRCCRQRRCR
eukprot:3565475-Prymnesium_polylepis.3